MQVYCCYTGRNGTYSVLGTQSQNSVLSPLLTRHYATAPTYDHLTAPATGSRITHG